MSITDLQDKIKDMSHSGALFLSNRDTILFIIILCTALGSYTLGAYSGGMTGGAPRIVFSQVTIPAFASSSNNDEDSAAQELTPNETGQSASVGVTGIFASRHGTKYYYSWCKSASRVKIANRVYYDTKEQAVASGKSLATSCK